MKKLFVTIIASLFFIPSYAQESSWEVIPPESGIKMPESYKKEDNLDSKGNEWKLFPKKLLKIFQNDTVVFEGFPENINGNYFSRVLSDEFSFLSYSVENNQHVNYLGYCDGQKLEFYKLNFNATNIYQTKGNIIFYDFYTGSRNRFDKIEKKFYQIVGISRYINNDELNPVVIDNRKYIYTFSDEKKEWLPLIYDSLKYSSSYYLKRNGIAFTTHMDTNKIYMFDYEKGLKSFEVSGLNGLGRMSFSNVISERDQIIMFENGYVLCSEGNATVCNYSDYKIPENSFLDTAIVQNNGITVISVRHNGGLNYSYFSCINGELVLEQVVFEPVRYNHRSNCFFKYKNGEFVYYSPVYDSKIPGYNSYNKLKVIKNGIDTTIIPLPYIFSYYSSGQVISEDYFWIGAFYDNIFLRLKRDKNIYKGKIFYDFDKDGKDNNKDVGFGQMSLTVQPSGLIVYPSVDGDFTFSGSPDSIYTLNISGEELLDYKSVSFPYKLTNRSGNFVGVTLKDPAPDVVPIVNMPRSRCSTTGQATVNLMNRGLGDADKVRLTIAGNKFGILSKEGVPGDSLNNILAFEITDLQKLSEKKFTYSVKWASGEHTGKFAAFVMKTEVFKNDQVINTIADSISSEIRCSWDPNDIAVSPAGVEDMHYTKMNSTLSYLIRFENTGNDTAYNVVVYDTLDANLDYPTVKVLGSSHAVQTEINHGIVAFRFANIMLPDAKTNKEKAQGFVRFSVKPKADLEGYTVIKNKAGIVFDQNSPVITNEVFNTMGDAPKIAGTTEAETVKKFMVYPNPSTGILNVKGNDVKKVEIFNNLGEMVLQSYESMINVEQLPAAVYLIKFYDTNGMLVSNEMFVKAE